MEADGCRCAPRSSKPVIAADNCLGEFDSHTLPPENIGRCYTYMNKDYKLTDMVCQGGCGAKIEASLLRELISEIPGPSPEVYENVLTGFGNCEDAAVYKLGDDLAVISTVDFFPPPVDDPFLFGEIAAANALSDVYAMGGKPVMAVNLLTFPKKMDKEAVSLILKGAAAIAEKAGVFIGGGHSIEDKEPKFGMAVTGTVHPDKILRNSGAKEGDVLVLTKKIGVGICLLAEKAGLLSGEDEDNLEKSLIRLNKNAACIAGKYKVNACTDVTGFGLLGHSLEMAEGSHVSVVIDSALVPSFEKTELFASMGIVPAGAYRNRRLLDGKLQMSLDSTAKEDILFCPETSGGLLLAIDEKEAGLYVSEMRKAGEEAYIIGRVTSAQKCTVIVEES